MAGARVSPGRADPRRMCGVRGTRRVWRMEQGINPGFDAHAGQQANHHRERRPPTPASAAHGSAGCGVRPRRGSPGAHHGLRHWGCSSWAPRRHPPFPSPAPAKRERADESPSTGGEGAAHQEHLRAWRPPALPWPPGSRTRRGQGFAGFFPQWPWPWSVCQCAAVHQGCPLLPWWLLSSKHEPRQGHRKWDFLVCPGRTEDQHNSSHCCQSPSQWIVFRGQEHPAGTTHTRKATHIERDSRLPVQFLSGFGTVPLKKILWKRRESCRKKYPPSPLRWLPCCSRFPKPNVAGTAL